MNGLLKFLMLTAMALLPAIFGGCGSRGAAAVNGPPVVEAPATPVNGEPAQIEPATVEAANSTANPSIAESTNTSTAASSNTTPPPAIEKTAPDEPAVKVAPAVDPAPVKTVAARVVDKTFDDVKFEMEPEEPFRRELVGEKIEALVGQRIRIRGYILPTAQKKGLKQFVLVRDNQQCCFGPGAALYDCIIIEMQPGRTAEFSIRPVAVEGTFNIDVMPGLEPGDKPLAIYRMDGEAVK